MAFYSLPPTDVSGYATWTKVSFGFTARGVRVTNEEPNPGDSTFLVSFDGVTQHARLQSGVPGLNELVVPARVDGVWLRQGLVGVAQTAQVVAWDSTP